MINTCFVIMPIGTQSFNGVVVTEEQLRERYNYIIREAVLKADPSLEVLRADEELNPGCITNDILTKLMHSKYVIADITYPNPNVFYELGIRHAIKTGTILIKEKAQAQVPFDISHLRYIEYGINPAGMHQLSEEFKKRFDYFNAHPVKPDNQFLELSEFTRYRPLNYAKESYDSPGKLFGALFSLAMKNQGLLNTFTDEESSDMQKQQAAIQLLLSDPEQLPLIAEGLMSLKNAAESK